MRLEDESYSQTESAGPPYASGRSRYGQDAERRRDYGDVSHLQPEAAEGKGCAEHAEYDSPDACERELFACDTSERTQGATQEDR